MDFNQLSQMSENYDDLGLPYQLTDFFQLENFLFINHKVAFKVDNISSEYDRLADVIIRNELSDDIGVLLFLKAEKKEISTLTEYQYVALLTEADNQVDLTNSHYTFKADFVIIDENYFYEYEEKYKQGAPIWGKFNHAYSGLTINPAVPRSVLVVQSIDLQGFNNTLYFEAAVRGLKHISPLERFLKYYHLLELNFDYDVIQRIKKLNVDTQASQIGVLLREYERKEFSRLIYLFDVYCVSVNPIVAILNLVASHPVIAKEMFFDFGAKDSNPFQEFSAYQSFVTDPQLFSFSNFKTLRNSKANQDSYRKFIGQVVMYMIYRIRNSIAHNKIGEYVLSSANQHFVTDFGEPLLLEILKQLFKS